VESIDEDVIHCSEINIGEKIFQRHPDLDFGLVGVFKDYGKKNIYHDIAKTDIHGKLVRTRGLIITAPNNVLTEK
jgi:hypothetical protein